MAPGFATQLEKQLDSNILDQSLARNLSQHLNKVFPVPTPPLVEKMDELGRSIWNASIQLRQQNTDKSGILPLLRVFAFYLLDGAYQAVFKRGQSTGDNLIRILRVALKAGKICIDHSHLDLCTRLCERAAVHVELQDRERRPPAKQLTNEQAIQDSLLEELIAEYYLLRAALAWKLERVDAIDYWLSKVVIRGELSSAAERVEKKADLLYEMGKAALKPNQYEVAVKWLQRSRDVVDSIDRESLSPDFCELRVAIMSDLIQALTALKVDDSLEKASNLIALLQLENGDFKMSTCMLQLNLIHAQSPVDGERFLDVLLRIIQSVHMIESNFDTVMYQIHKLKKLNATKDIDNSVSLSLACQALDCLLPRLFQPGCQGWLEKATVTRIWFVVTGLPVAEDAAKLKELFEESYSTTGQPFSPEATHAAQSLIWKQIDINPVSQSNGGAEVWCRLACHKLFQKAGDLNKAKIGRKMMLNGLARGDGTIAREAYFEMPETGKTTAITKYILYKVALRIEDADLAAEALDGVLKTSSKDAKFLYACALEAQQHGNKRQAIAVLQKVLEHCKYSPPEGTYLPALLRSIAKVITMEMECGNTEKQPALLDLCKIFEGAMAQAQTFQDAGPTSHPGQQRRAELTWFASYSYNLALNHLSDIVPELLVRLMIVCVSFVEMLRNEYNDDLLLIQRGLLCRFLAASALVVLGRSEDNVERALSFYLDARRQIEAFQKSLKDVGQHNNLQDDIRTDLVIKDFELLKYDLEALLKLQQWNDLDRVLEVC